MNFSSILITAFIHTNIALCAGALASAFLLYAIQNSYLKPSHAMRITHSLMVFIVLLPAILLILPEKSFFEPATQIWSAPSMREIEFCRSSSDIGIYSSIDVMNGSHIILYHSFATIIIFCTILGVLIHSIRLLSGAMSIRRILKEAVLFRVIGNVRLYAADHALAPFSIWFPGSFIVVIPTSIIASSETFFISISHELQHHRQRDTIWIYAFQMLKAFFLWNPLVYLMERKIFEIQEMSCDEFLVAHRKIAPCNYTRCLVGVAEIACKRCIPLCTIGMPTRLSGKKLKRRLDILIANNYGAIRFGSAMLYAVLCLCFVAVISFASQGLVQDRRISPEEANRMAEKVAWDPSFPIVVNDSVLMQLNCYLGTPDGRAYMRSALNRMAVHGEMIKEKLAEYGAPEALLAVPLVESGYRNIPQGENSFGAGLWQFIQPTAIHYGLRVDNKVDERLDTVMETDAAIRYLMENNFRFRDWGLSLLAYNMGEKNVQKGIDATGSRDPWTLIQSGYEGDKNYLSKFMAALIIMYNPSSLE